MSSIVGDNPWSVHQQAVDGVPTVYTTTAVAEGWRTWPWRTIIFLHFIFLIANVAPDNIPFPTEKGASIDRLVEAADSGQLGRRIGYLVLGAVSMYGLLKYDRRRLYVRGVLGVLMLGFFAWCCMSLGWADDVPTAARKVMIFVLLWLGAMWVAARLSPINLLRFGFFSTVLTLFTCLGIEVGFGRFRPWVGGYRFAGYYHPNETGQCLVVATLASIALAGASRNRTSTLRYVGFALISLAFLVTTGSRTSLISVLFGIMVYWVIYSLGNWRSARSLIITSGLGGSLYAIGYLLLSSDLGKTIGTSLMLGRADSDISTLTERTPMWHELIKHYISARPLTGCGYASFWGEKHVIAMSLLRKGSVYFHSHSGYLEMALSIGVIGAAVHVLTIILAAKWLIAQYIKDKDPGDAFGSALLITLMVSMFTEATNMSSYLMPTFLDMVFIVNAAFLRRPDWRVAARAPLSWWEFRARSAASL